MPRPEGVHATYTPDHATVMIFKTEQEAHRTRGITAEYVFWPFGMTLAEAITATAPKTPAQIIATTGVSVEDIDHRTKGLKS